MKNLVLLLAVALCCGCGVSAPTKSTSDSTLTSDFYVDSIHVKVNRYPDGSYDSTGYKNDRIKFKYRNGKSVKYPN